MKNKYNNPSSPLVDIIMPANNAAQYIGAAIESVLQQTHTNLKLIVVDDGSSDNTVEIVKKSASDNSRVSIIELETQSGGPATPRNRALQNIDGALVAFIDADDVWHPDKLQCQIQAMLAHELDFSSTRHIKFIDTLKTELMESNVIEDPAISVISHDQILRKNKIVCSGVMMQAAAAQKLTFSEQAEFVGVEDYLAWLKLLQNKALRAAIIEAPLVFYRLRRDSLSNSKFRMAKKIYALLSDYSYNGQRLGIKKYFYFGCYMVAGVTTLISDKLKTN